MTSAAIFIDYASVTDRRTDGRTVSCSIVRCTPMRRAVNKAIVDVMTSPPVLPPSESLRVYAAIVTPPQDQIWANMTSSTKPEVHNVLHRRHMVTEPRPQVTRVENYVKFGRVVFENMRAGRQTDRPTDTLIA